jgi:rhodanese-related sulfurtransferase
MNMLKSVALFGMVVLTLACVPALASADELGGVGEQVSQAAPKGPNAGIAPGHYGLIASYANSFFSSAASNLPRANTYRYVAWSSINPADYFIIDARQNKMIGTAKGYCDGHLPEARNIPFQFAATPENLVQLPTDNAKILVICYSGVSAAEVSTVLNLLGYNSYTLNGGITGVPAALLVPEGDACSCSGDTPAWNGSTCTSCPAGTSWNGAQCL